MTLKLLYILLLFLNNFYIYIKFAEKRKQSNLKKIIEIEEERKERCAALIENSEKLTTKLDTLIEKLENFMDKF